jgi:predicted amidohydrolase YtcJ
MRANKTKVIYNGRVYLERGSFCEALIAEGARVARTGPSRELLEEAPAGAEKIDAGGALVLPAFHDSHLHLMWVGRRAWGIEAAGAASIDEVISRGRELIARLKPPPGAYVQGAGVNPDLFTAGEKRDLLREDVDRISTEHPVIISRHCGHTIYCNSLALRMAGVSETAPDVEGGTIEKDGNGRPTGVFREGGANTLVRGPMPAPAREDMKGFLALAMKKAHSLGICSCGSYDTGGPDFESVLGVYREIYDESRGAGAPALRVTMQCGISAREDMLDALLGREERRAPLWEHPLWGTFLKVGSIKLFVDGTLGGQTAWMRRPYRDKPETSGMALLDQNRLERFVEKAASGGMQALVHAIGDAGIAAVLSAFEKVTAPGANPLRHAVIHCQITSPDLLERMARNRILAVVQPVFLADDMPVLESRVGPELASTSYAWGSMQRAGIPVSYSTDAPVSDLNPLLGIEWAVLRRDSGNPASTACYPRERVDVYTAVDNYTAAPAFSSFDENSLGRIAPGYFADMVFLDRDIFAVPPDEIHRARVLRTMCAGETVYTA